MRMSYTDSAHAVKRSYRLFAAVLTVHCTVCAPVLLAQDYARPAERTIMGTARYVGMGGAMSAIGGDPSSVGDNPAGLGLYRRSEVMLSFDHSSVFTVPQASAVFCLGKNNLMISYNRRHTYNRSGVGSATNSPSLGALIATATTVDLKIPYCSEPLNQYNELSLRESGYVNEYNFNWAMNISHQWNVGAGLQVHSFSMSSDADFYESFNRPNTNRNVTSVIYKGAGCSLSAGVIYRPLNWLRVGFGIQTPSIGAYRIYTSGTFWAQTDTLRYSDAPSVTSSAADFHMPLHTSTSVAFQIGYYALIGLQYDYSHQAGEIDIHSLRAGVEVVPVPGFYINAGYVYESPFRTVNKVVHIDSNFNRQDAYFQRPRWSQYISGALGYRGKAFIVQAAYQFRMQRFQLFAHENADPYLMAGNTHRVVITLGWHQN